MYSGLLYIAKCDVVASFTRSTFQMSMDPFFTDKAWTVVLLSGCWPRYLSPVVVVYLWCKGFEGRLVGRGLYKGKPLLSCRCLEIVDESLHVLLACDIRKVVI